MKQVMCPLYVQYCGPSFMGRWSYGAAAAAMVVFTIYMLFVCCDFCVLCCGVYCIVESTCKKSRCVPIEYHPEYAASSVPEYAELSGLYCEPIELEKRKLLSSFSLNSSGHQLATHLSARPAPP